jgi:hypothetical protein
VDVGDGEEQPLTSPVVRHWHCNCLARHVAPRPSPTSGSLTPLA